MPGPLNVLDLANRMNNMDKETLYLGLADKDGNEICSPNTSEYKRVPISIVDFGYQGHRGIDILGIKSPGSYSRRPPGLPSEQVVYELKLPNHGPTAGIRMILLFEGSDQGAQLLDRTFVREIDNPEGASAKSCKITVLRNWICQVLDKKLKAAWSTTPFVLPITRHETISTGPK